ncbi:hypothetical protein HUA78_15645 [Myxococcus sp. CA033]|uniref:hypothetical protein n=1 Tax=Myxococcus sp. CA033 TaxID=2741516 RepID=UPI00157A9403|nr:hypothetical protein [Myxococcus sp. CA033]NTX35882.1 hypothetical protein [Myxococcus sp. CA033]
MMTVLVPAAARAFAEDVCYPKGSGTVANCTTLPKSCSLKEPTSPRCRAEALEVLLSAPNKFDGGRSVVHSDATYLMARAVGFSFSDAYWIAAYDEATDLGQFIPRDIYGQPVPGAADLTTVDVSGLVRTNLSTGGVLYHYLAPYNGVLAVPPTGVNGLAPEVDDADTEVMLAHTRAWAMEGAGAAAPLCTAGLTVASPGGDLATGSACYTDKGGESVEVKGLIGLYDDLAIPFTLSTGEQVISVASDSGAPPVLSNQFDTWVGGGASHVADARLGIHLHALADRISHHVCTDRAEFVGPLGVDGGFRQDFTGHECGQGLHSLRHLYEIGVDFSKLSPQDRTTAATLSAVYDELVVFARLRGVLVPAATEPAFKAALINGQLLPAMQTPEVLSRLARLSATACERGWSPFPGSPSCPRTTPAPEE